MKALGKVLGLVIFGVLLLAIALLFFLTRIFDPNDYKDNIREAARDKANVELTLDGDIGWSLFPWLGIELEQVGIAPVDRPDQPLAEVGSLGLGVEVLPLLRRQLRFSDVILNNVSLSLVRDADGQGNWETVGPRSEATTKDDTPANEPGAEPGAEQGQELDIAVQSVNITNARILYEDRKTGQQVQLNDVNLKTGALVEGKPFDVSFIGLLTTEQPALRLRIDLQTVAQFDRGLERYQFDAINLNLDASGAPLSGRAVSLQLQADGVLDLGARVAELDQVRLSLDDLRATGRIKATQLDQDMQLAGRLDVAQFNARGLIEALGQELPETANPRALEAVSLSSALAGSASSLMLEDLKMQVDGNEFAGSLGLTDFERQALRFRLVGDRLNLDDYLPPIDETTVPQPSGTSGGSKSEAAPIAWSDDPVLPLGLLADLDVDGSLEMQEIVLTGQSIAPFAAAAKARDGLLQLSRFEGGMFGGDFAATGRVDARTRPVALSAKKKLTGMDSLAIQEAYDVAPQLRGAIDLDMDVRATGNSMQQWMSSLNGQARFNVDDGALLGINLEQQLCQAIAMVNRETLAAPVGSENTPFTTLKGSFRIVDGTVINDNLVADLPGITARGRGEIALPTQRLDYRVGLVLEGDNVEMPDSACRVNERYIGVEWPIRCSGYLHNAASSCRVDSEAVTQLAGKLLGNEARRKVEDKISEKLEEQAPAVRDALRGLFGQ
ncbi:AsmA family protein [Halopseudomonas sp.]|uniref:AsmA family protein n=1 Tax=Halopseudomonas sp. TaxID=2901191 RepID=UPI003565A39D